MRPRAELPVRVGQANPIEHLDDLPVRGAALRDAVTHKDLAQLPADAQVRVERLHRVLENHADAARPDRVELPAGRANQLVSAKPDAAADRGVRWQQAEDCERGLRLAGAGLADQPDRLAAPQFE